MPITSSVPVLRAENLSKRYGRREAVGEVNLTIPSGRVVGLVGPNGAGKSTLLNMACGLLQPTTGTLSVLGSPPAETAKHLARVGFVPQDTPVYASFTVADHLRMGAHLNPSWDHNLAERRVRQVGLDPRQKAGRLSGGQRAQLSMTIAASKRPDLLIFDEPAAALDPLARQGFLENLMSLVGELGASAILSSHLLGDIERVCDYLIVMGNARIQVAGEVSRLLAIHHRAPASAVEAGELPAGFEVVWTERTDAGAAIVRAEKPNAARPPGWEAVTVEELVLAYMTRATSFAGNSGATTDGGVR